MGKLKTISSLVRIQDVGSLRDFNPFNYVVEFVRDCTSLTSDNHDQVGFGGKGLGWRRRDFHGCVTDPRLLMIPKRICIGLLGDLWELMFPKRICFGSLGDPWELIICKRICFGL
jgi:hypothetical protein